MMPPAESVYVVCALADIPNRRARGFQLLHRAADGAHKAFAIFIVRWGQQVFAYVNQCPHDRTHLDWERNQFLDPNGLRLMCGKHGALFEIGTGRCVEGPCRGAALQSVDVVVLDDEVCIRGVELVEDVAAPEAAP